MKDDKLIIGGHAFDSRFILGSGKYNVELIKAAIEYAGAEIITLAPRRANSEGEGNIMDHIPRGVTLLPNTSGARSAEEAVLCSYALYVSGFKCGQGPGERRGIGDHAAGRAAYLAGLGRIMEKGGQESSPLTGFLQE